MLSPDIPASLRPAETMQICPLANLSDATVSFERHDDGETEVHVSSVATAQVTPRSTLLARLGGASRLEVLDEVVEVAHHASGDQRISDPIPEARRKAVSEVLFKHVAINCIECPRAEHCRVRAPIAQLARELAAGMTSPSQRPD